jgi:ubiquinone/menaquinone biosynthesis C-methylase UbiE
MPGCPVAAEFTGERVVPGQVDADLWNEHFARYVFAARLARGKRVLDLGCGTAYGSAEMAKYAAAVTALDISQDAVEYAVLNTTQSNVRFVQASAAAIPMRDASFDLVVAFEVIEHITEWRELLSDVRRILAPGGQLVVSTPNKSYYAESRKQSGPNPFHEHEFEFEEFKQALEEFFPHVLLFTENHADGIVFKPITNANLPVSADIRVESAHADPASAHFYVAVCAMVPQTGGPTFVYMPTAANVLRERELHIARLEAELQTKDEWLNAARAEHQQLVQLHTKQTSELEARNNWAISLNAKVATLGTRIQELQSEIETEQAAARTAVEAYKAEAARLEAGVLRLERQLQASVTAGEENEIRLTTEIAAHVAELSKCVELLHAAEDIVEQRTEWVNRLAEEITIHEERLLSAHGSKWMRLGRALGLGPELRKT